MNRRLLLALLVGLAATTGQAVLGDTFAQLRERLGRPEPQTRKDAAVWFFEVEDGRLVYTATLNGKGLSIAEGLKPLKRAIFTRDAAEDFIDRQLAPSKGSKTRLSLKPGEKYVFAGKPFTCGDEEYVTVDEASDLMIIWNRSRAPSVVAVRSEMVK